MFAFRFSVGGRYRCRQSQLPICQPSDGICTRAEGALHGQTYPGLALRRKATAQQTKNGSVLPQQLLQYLTQLWKLTDRTSPQRLHRVMYCPRLGVRPVCSPRLGPRTHRDTPRQPPPIQRIACSLSSTIPVLPRSSLWLLPGLVSLGYKHPLAAHARLPEASYLDATF